MQQIGTVWASLDRRKQIIVAGAIVLVFLGILGMSRLVTAPSMTLLYAAEDLGLATCPMMGFRQLDLKRWLSLAPHEIPIMLVALGKAGEAEPSRLPRKAATEISRRLE